MLREPISCVLFWSQTPKGGSIKAVRKEKVGIAIVGMRVDL